jgi:uncharacterized protein YndB with AHSA1/START domain
MPDEQRSRRPFVREVTIARALDAPPEDVWRAWTEPDHLSRWFGTPPFATSRETVFMDVRPGGEWRATMISSEDGAELPFVGVYREVQEPERLVFTFENPDDRDDPDVEVATVELSEVAGTTRMCFSQDGHLPDDQYPLLEAGYSRFFDRMAALLRTGPDG